jgi:dTDP-3-amino-2,3,6-trideoxy-4-keto-D-glucose/dTDP-3-amino-3,4,6-trideoxy-alpha-D-glucose/dTDP-2,6-dideoxy-D-kanosamine transaminase
MKVRYSYLQDQFANPDEILSLIKEVVLTGDFTLGRQVGEFEEKFANLIGTRYAIGVGSGTDALMLSLAALGVGFGDEVITAANTFIATAGAINALGAKPVFVDVTPYYTLDIDQIEKAITEKTRAIMPVHLTGEPADMTPLMELSQKHRIPIVEDACQSILAEFDGKRAGTFGSMAGFSLHPLKNLNVWGDSGIIVTDSEEHAKRLRLLRNHGMRNRDEIEIMGYNSRLDTVQAVVGNWLIDQVHDITGNRIANGAAYDAAFVEMGDYITLPHRRPNVRRVFHLYMIEVEDRDELLKYLVDKGVEAKIHYPIPLFLQDGLSYLGYVKGDFPVTEKQADRILTLPVDQHLGSEQLQYVIQVIQDYYARR